MMSRQGAAGERGVGGEPSAGVEREPERDPDAGAILRPEALDAVIFDLDGVLTDTAGLHLRAWKDAFDAFLERRAEAGDGTFEPFTREDYLRHVDGKSRYDGARDFLRARGVEIPFGEPADPAGRDTVCGLANRKNDLYRSRLRQGELEALPSSVALVDRLRGEGMGTAVVTSSRTGREVLEATGLTDRFGAVVDGTDLADDPSLAGKPAPDLFVEAARRLGVEPARSAVVEDAVSGIRAGRRGGFALVIGVARDRDPEELTDAGADRVVRDLSELSVGPRPTPIDELPSALGRARELEERIGRRTPALFLDYDGTLTPIVEDPAEATLSPETREALGRAAERMPVAVISGRDLDDVRSMVGLEGIWYAGSHGFDLAGPGGEREQRGEALLPALAAAEEELREELEGTEAVAGVSVERKRFAVAVHYRRTPEERIPEVRRRVRRVAAGRPELRLTGGKKIFELRPDLDWDKGRALRWLWDVLELDTSAHHPIYVGDDVTDEDAFRALSGQLRGTGVVVRGEDDRRESRARYALADTGEARALLEQLTDRGGVDR